jgi:glutamate dehydrogenase
VVSGVTDGGGPSAETARLRARLARRFASVEAEQMAEFASRLLAKGGAVYGEALGDDDVLAMVASAFRFFVAAGAPPRVRAFTPRFASDGWEGPFSVVETCMPDCPFIVDTVREYVRHEGLVVRHLLHPVLVTQRERDGGLVALRRGGEEGTRESFIHVALEKVADDAALARVEEELRTRLEDVRLTTADYRPMLERVEAMAQDLEWLVERPGLRGRGPELTEVAAFLRWLAAGGFVFLGYREYALQESGAGTALALVAGSGLGILRREERSAFAQPRPLAGLPEGVRVRLQGPRVLTVTKANAESPVHRLTRMDDVGVQRLSPDGRCVGVRRLLGLFTSKAYTEESVDVPVLRRKLGEILAAEQAVPGSHDYKEIVTVFNSFPKEELFAASAADIHADIRTVLAGHPEEILVSIRQDVLERRNAVMVIMPRDKFSGAVRHGIQDLLVARSGGTLIDYRLALGEGEQARLHFSLGGHVDAAALRPEALQREIAELVRTWEDRLLERLQAAFPPPEARRLAARFGQAFSSDYKAVTDAAAAANDVRLILELERTRAPQVQLANRAGAREDRFTCLRLFLLDEELVLSEFIPILENLGLRVYAEDPVVVTLPEGPRVYVRNFFVQDHRGARLDVRQIGGHLEAALLAVRAGAVESDRLNTLVLSAGLDWRAVDCLRTLANYALQVGLAPARAAVYGALAGHPAPARALFGLFAARFAPDGGDPGAARQAFLDSLDGVQRLSDDRILRHLLAVVEAIVRTTFFRTPRAEHPYVAVKIHAAALEPIPRPRPLYEIYVHSARMEGVHLRGGLVARGGIRHSDRVDDFRTEILGLMKTQTVKNAVIVPVGAKGGFVVKGGGGPAAVREAYSTLIRGLLDLTDNRIGDHVRHPEGLRIYDGEDPYLVVAADKGTATFSDLANGIAAEYRFWLGDAFASGGSHGYDHKKLGITARGAWECVRSHFREANRDVEDGLTAIGIGDMGGDVFGNGLLLSPAVRLRAAFNHGHVFLDPSPDPAVSHAERARLFREGRGWDGYDPAALGPGGMVVPRGQKRVVLSAEARAFLGVAQEAIDGEGLVRAVLRAEADLLWNGGIGTYVKASTESHAAAEDGVNDAVRIDARELRVAVVGEGGNLGLTQRARIEYALGGGRVNTDAIDNSGGVDLSDHEVNLKILLQPLLDAGELSALQRNRLLEELAPEIVARVLAHNRGQHRILSLDQWRSQTQLVEYREHVAQLEAEGLIDRALDALPDREALRARRGQFLGLTRPELAVVLACTKIAAQRRLLAAPALLDEPALEPFLQRYFPPLVGELFAAQLGSHRLRREIIATELINELVDAMGCTFLHGVTRDTGRDVPDAVRAWVVAWDLVGGPDLSARLCPEGGGPGGEVGRQCHHTLATVAEGLTKWILANTPADRPAQALLDELRPALVAARARLPHWFSEREAELDGRRAAELEIAGLPADLARELALAERLEGTLDVVTVAAELRADPEGVAKLYYGLSSWVDFPWLFAKIAEAGEEDRWQQRAAQGLAEDLAHARRRLVRRLHAAGAAVAGPDAPGLSRARAEKVASLIADIKAAPRLTAAALQVAVRELVRLSEAAAE